MTTSLGSFEKTIIRLQTLQKAKTLFHKKLENSLSLCTVDAPLFVEKDSGLQDDLNGVERPIEFTPKHHPKPQQVVHSLAKWKRHFLGLHHFPAGKGIVTHMKAIRADEEIDSTHSIQVEQWDWEKVIDSSERKIEKLTETAQRVYDSFRESFIELHGQGQSHLYPEKLTFITTEDLRGQYPHLSPKERERKFCRLHKAVFLMGIGGKLSDGKEHDLRAPDYDDWTLNGDIIVWSYEMEREIEISSMGIRVDSMALEKQLELRDLKQRKKMPWHQKLLRGELPQTIGGGIGKQRILLLLMRESDLHKITAE